MSCFDLFYIFVDESKIELNYKKRKTYKKTKKTFSMPDSKS
jgi:hypothetical protein